MAELLERVLERGAERRRLVAKVYGGACVVPAFRSRNLGTDNVEVALRALERERIALGGSDVGGSRGRKIIFHSDVGSVWVRSL